MIRNASGETLDLKAYEADMRHLIDTYIEAKKPRKISPFDDMSLLDIIAQPRRRRCYRHASGSLRRNKDAVAETIENNVRAKIVKERLTDPAFYDKMSKLLDEIIQARKVKALAYEEYLKQIAQLLDAVRVGHDGNQPSTIRTEGQRALVQQPRRRTRTCQTDRRQDQTGPASGLAGRHAREQEIKRAIYEIVKGEAETERLFRIIYHQREY